MSLKTHKFVRKPFYVDAARVTEANMADVAEWCEGTIEEKDGNKYIKVTVYRPANDRQTEAYVGDWVLKAGTGGFKVYVPKAFDKSFEKVKTLNKEQADAAGIKVPHEPRPKKKGRVEFDQPAPGSNPVIPADVADKIKVDDVQSLDEKSEAMAVQAEAIDPNVVPEENVVDAKPAPKSKADVEADKLIEEVLSGEA